jgi:hypothetical protein
MAGSKASAQNVDAETRNMLITKLTHVYLNLAPSDSSKVALTLRLADLHAERARIDAMNELASGCGVCTAGKDDRLKALAYYKEVLGKVPESSIGKVLAQVGHLYELTGNEKEAIATYEKILLEQKSPAILAEADLSLAEVHFKRRDFALAKKHYAAVLANPQAGSRGLAAYREAWCDFNEGNLENAIAGLTRVLKTPQLLSRSASAGIVQVDKQFQEEVSRDLATFFARRNVMVKDAEIIYELSPEQAKLANIIYLATEAERLGQAGAAISLWRYSQEKQAKPQARLEGHIHLAQIEMEQKLRKEAIGDFEAALTLWSKLGQCDGQDCKELKARLRKFVIEWNRVEKKAPSEELLSAYRSYLKVFSNEIDTTVWAAQVANDLKKYADAVQLYQSAATLAATLASTPESTKEASEKLEVSLLGAIESAELSKDPKLLDSCYESYLRLSHDRKKAVEVNYQKAHLLYEATDYSKAAEALKGVALLKDAGNAELKKQAADLSLDALVLLKDDARLERWAAEFAQIFPAASKDYLSISRKAILTQAAQAASSQGDSSLNDAWKTLSRFDIGQASNDEKIAFYKNKLILSEKLRKFGEARDAAEMLLKLPNLSVQDQQYALSRKAWLAELVLDFESALAATEKIAAPEASSQKWLKLAMYADLAAKDPKPFYHQFLKESKDDEKNVAIASQLVRDSKEPLKEMEKQKATLGKRPETLAELYLEIFAKTGSLDVAKKALQVSGVSATSAGKALSRALILDDYAKLRSEISSHQLDGSNQKKMAATLKTRVAMLDRAEKLANRAIESGDWTAELVTLDLLGAQNERFYQDILGLPVPQGLSAEDEQQYLMLLSQQAAPHQTRASDVKKKVGEFWENEKGLAALDEALNRESGALRAILVKEVKVLADVAPETKKPALIAMSERKEAAKEIPTLMTLEKARQAVRENPMSRGNLEALLGLEKKMGRHAMVSYLEGRLSSLETSHEKSLEK